MGVRLQHWVGAAILATSAALIPGEAWAQTPAPAASPLNQPTIPEVVDDLATLERFWLERSIAGEAIFTFGIEYDENRIARSGRRLEALYRDLLQDQTQGALIRTRDLENPYSTSLLQLSSPTLESSSSGFSLPTP